MIVDQGNQELDVVLSEVGSPIGDQITQPDATPGLLAVGISGDRQDTRLLLRLIGGRKQFENQIELL